jgi:hypothetical protein
LTDPDDSVGGKFVDVGLVQAHLEKDLDGVLAKGRRREVEGRRLVSEEPGRAWLLKSTPIGVRIACDHAGGDVRRIVEERLPLIQSGERCRDARLGKRRKKLLGPQRLYLSGEVIDVRYADKTKVALDGSLISEW